MPKMITIQVQMLVNDEDVAVREAEDDLVQGLNLIEDAGELIYAEWWGGTKILDIHEATEEEMDVFWESL